VDYIKSLFKPGFLKKNIEFFKGKSLFISVPLTIIFMSFLIYGFAVWINLFIIIYDNGFSFYQILDIAAGQWAEFMTSYTPQWAKSWSSWPSIILNSLWVTFVGFLPTILVLIWGAIILIYAAAYFLGFIGNFLIIFKRWILNQ